MTLKTPQVSCDIQYGTHEEWFASRVPYIRSIAKKNLPKEHNSLPRTYLLILNRPILNLPLLQAYTFQVPANRTTHRANMSIKHHNQSDNVGHVTIRIVLICSLLLIGIFIIGMLALHLSTKRDRKLVDLEACQYLLDEDNPGFYGTFQSSPHTVDDLEARRALRHEQLCNNISGVYRISVQRLEGAEVSSSDESGSNITPLPNANIVNGESSEESSESESESNSDSSSESPEDVEVSRLMSMKKPLLPKRVAALRGM